MECLMGKYAWLEKRTPRSVDQLRLWEQNPRLNPEETHSRLSDFVADLISENSDKEAFLKLMDSIVANGFVAAEPVVVWQDQTNGKFYVAEGNRRVMALKLLRHPEKAPREIRNIVARKAKLINLDSIEKISVSVAPSFEDCEWYINHRHTVGSVRNWTRLQWQREIVRLYDTYGGNVDKVLEKANISTTELNDTLRIIKVRDLVMNPVVYEGLSEEEKVSAKSHRIPMTILERWFNSAVVKERWGYRFTEDNIEIISNKPSFLNAFKVFIQLVIKRDLDGIDPVINTRTVTSNLENILNALPQVTFDSDEGEYTPITEDNKPSQGESGAKLDNKDDAAITSPAKPINAGLTRNKLIPENFHLKTSNQKLLALFSELKRLPVGNYPNSVAAMLRVFLDLAVDDYIKQNDLADSIRTNGGYQTLAQKLKYFREDIFKGKNSPARKILDKLSNHTNEHSLDTLNNYIHSSEIHKIEKVFLNGFWDFLFPLFSEILEIEEI